MKNVNKYLVLTLVALFSLFTAFSPIVHAEAVSTGTSKATITFTPSEGPPDVLDPSDPHIPYEPGPNDPQDPPTGNTGPLTLDYVSSVDFGKQQIDGQEMVYHSTILRPFIQVTDRRGTGAGWTVTAQMSNFTADREGTTVDTLPGAVVTFLNGEVISPNMVNEPEPFKVVTLNAGGNAAQVVNATVNTGLGTWINRWFPTDQAADGLNDSVTLTVPAGTATNGNHSATITWTLTDAPG